MEKCMDCQHYKYYREIYFYTNGNKICCGECTKDKDRADGNLTFECSHSCKDFVQQKTPKYNIGDVFVNAEEIIYIIRIIQNYYPRIYTVSNNNNSVWSMSENEIEEKYIKINFNNAN